MSGIRIGGKAFQLMCSPPVAALGGSSTPFGDPQIYRSCVTDAPGEMTAYTDFLNFTEADQCHNPVLSPDGTKILFEILQTATGYREVWVVDAVPGSTPTPLVQDVSNYVIHPSWGPDSDTFVYVHCAAGALLSGTIYKDTVSAPGSPTALKAAAGGRSPWRPQVNFDGTRVAYIWDEDAGTACDLRCMDDDGANDASLDNTIAGYLFTEPPQFGWATTQNLIAYSDAQGSRNVYVIADDGTGKTQLDANGVLAGNGTCNVSGFPWAPGDEFVVVTANLSLGDGIQVFRCEVDGSDSVLLGGFPGPPNNNWFRTAIVFESRIWYISAIASAGAGRIRSMAMDGSDEVENFDNTEGTGTAVEDFTGGDGFYYN